MSYENQMTVMVVAERHEPSITVRAPEDCHRALRRYWTKTKEHFLVITLNGNHGIIGIRIASIGTINRTIVHPREVFQFALKDNAAAIIVAHNHPSGNTDPSSEDLDITQRLAKAGELMGIPILDHLIFAKKSYSSLVSLGLMPPSSKE